jgi:hypothetical protein
MTQFGAVVIIDGKARRVILEAADEEEALSITHRLGIGLDVTQPVDRPMVERQARPEAYDEDTTRKLLGNISRTTLWRLIVRGKLERVPSVRRVLVTRKSIERFCACR